MTPKPKEVTITVPGIFLREVDGWPLWTGDGLIEAETGQRLHQILAAGTPRRRGKGYSETYVFTLPADVDAVRYLGERADFLVQVGEQDKNYRLVQAASTLVTTCHALCHGAAKAK